MNDTSNHDQKTEKPTPKRLRDARKQGDVPKSKDVSNTLGLAGALSVLWFTFSSQLARLSDMLLATLAVPTEPFLYTLNSLGLEAAAIFITVSAVVLLPIAFFGLLVEFVQTGPVFTLNKIMPRASNVHLGSGLKRMFGMDSFFEALFAILKTLVLFMVAFIVIKQFVTQLVLLPGSNPLHIVQAVGAMLKQFFLWTLAIFTALMLLDLIYRRYSYNKRMRMSVRDIKEEQRSTEGDAHMKGQRRQLHQEYAEADHFEAAKTATALIVNPTHVAIAIQYDTNNIPVPVVTAKGRDAQAQEMRDAANENHIPVLRNERLARTLLSSVDEGELIPRGLFDAVAEVIHWARHTSSIIDQQLNNMPLNGKSVVAIKPPGENLTVYPEGGQISDTRTPLPDLNSKAVVKLDV